MIPKMKAMRTSIIAYGIVDVHQFFAGPIARRFGERLERSSRSACSHTPDSLRAAADEVATHLASR
jgi:hypothetical protein